MRGALRRPGRLVPLLVVALLHAGCATGLPIRFLEPDGATIEVRRPGLLTIDQGGTVPFEAELAGGAYEVQVSLPARSGEPTPPLRGVLVVREVGRWEKSPMPAEFRLMAWDLERVGEGTEVRWACAGQGWMDLRFKGSLRGFPHDDPEVREWLAEGASQPSRASAASGPRPEPAEESDTGSTLGKIGLGVLVGIYYLGVAIFWGLAIIFGAAG